MRPTINPVTNVVSDWTSNPILSPIPSLILETSLKNKLHTERKKNVASTRKVSSFATWASVRKTIFMVQLLPITVFLKVKYYVVWPRKVSYFLWNCNAINLLLSEKAEILSVVKNHFHFLNSRSLICVVRVGYLEIKDKGFHVGNPVKAIHTAGLSRHLFQPSLCPEVNCFHFMGVIPQAWL